MAYPNRNILTQRFIPSRQLLPGDWANSITDALTSAQTLSPAGAATQAGATAINGAQVEILAGSAASAVKLPPALPGAEINILNNSANNQQVFGTGTDVVQTTGTTYAAAATGITMATLVSAKFFCIKAGFWQRLVTA